MPIDTQRDKDEVARQLRDVEKQIEMLLERIIEAEHASVIKAYESKIAKLEREKLLLAEKVDRIVPPKGRLEEFIEPALDFLANPWNLCENGTLAFKRTVLRLAFSEPLRYSRDSGYRTAEIALPFKVLAEISTSKGKMVEPRGVEPLTS